MSIICFTAVNKKKKIRNVRQSYNKNIKNIYFSEKSQQHSKLQCVQGRNKFL